MRAIRQDGDLLAHQGIDRRCDQVVRVGLQNKGSADRWRTRQEVVGPGIVDKPGVHRAVGADRQEVDRLVLSRGQAGVDRGPGRRRGVEVFAIQQPQGQIVNQDLGRSGIALFRHSGQDDREGWQWREARRRRNRNVRSTSWHVTINSQVCKGLCLEDGFCVEIAGLRIREKGNRDRDQVAGVFDAARRVARADHNGAGLPGEAVDQAIVGTERDRDLRIGVVQPGTVQPGQGVRLSLAGDQQVIDDLKLSKVGIGVPGREGEVRRPAARRVDRHAGERDHRHTWHDDPVQLDLLCPILLCDRHHRGPVARAGGHQLGMDFHE